MLSSLQSGESGVSGNDAVSHHGGAGTLPSRIHLAFALYRCFLLIPTAGHWKAPFALDCGPWPCSRVSRHGLDHYDVVNYDTPVRIGLAGLVVMRRSFCWNCQRYGSKISRRVTGTVI